MKWYQHDPDAFNSGTVQLTLEETGAYILILNALYSRDGDLPADDALLSRVLHVRPQTWRRVKAGLVAKGKIWVTADGKIMGKRVQTTLKSFENFSQTQTKRAVKGWEKRKNPNEHSGRAMPSSAMPGRNANTTTKKELLTYSLTPSERDELATALPTGALARPPPEKPIHELTGAEVMEQRRKKAADRQSAEGQVLDPPTTLQ